MSWCWGLCWAARSIFTLVVFFLRHISAPFWPNQHRSNPPNWAEDLRDEVLDEISKHGDVTYIHVDKDSLVSLAWWRISTPHPQRSLRTATFLLAHAHHFPPPDLAGWQHLRSLYK